VNVQEYEAAAAKLGQAARACPCRTVVESGLEKKTDFEDKKGLEKLLKQLEKTKLELEGKIVFDEEHKLARDSVWPAAQPEEYQLGRGVNGRI